MRILATGGGTGGHVYPALAVLAAFYRDRRRGTLADVLWVGRERGMEKELVQRAGVRYAGVSAGPLRGASVSGAIASLAQLARGIVEASRLIEDVRPAAVLATGGYVSAPAILAAWLRRCPCLIYLPDMEPGMAVRVLSRFVRRVAVSFDTVAVHFPPRQVVVTGYPVREALLTTTRAEGRAALGLVEEWPTLLVLGGSTGARSINNALREALPGLLRICQVVHVCGQADVEAMGACRAALSDGERTRYHLYAYLHEMPQAMAAANLVVARSGAATLGEFPAVGLPAVLVPYPYSGQHQARNAAFLAERGAAVVIEDADLRARLLPTVQGLLSDPERLERMAAAARGLARADAAERIAAELAILAEGGARG